MGSPLLSVFLNKTAIFIIVNNLIMPTKEYIREYREKRKNFCLDYLGGQCVKCGETKNLHFDHITPNNKFKEISSLYTSNLQILKDELDKCQLLCYECHHEKSLNEGDYLGNRKTWEHGVSGYINQKCRCNHCVESYKEWRKKRWIKEKR
jgi:hypothetical protein